jgi:hypothetical protein
MTADLPPSLRRLYDADPISEDELKASVNLEFIFRRALNLMISLQFDIDSELIWSLKLNEIDEATRIDLVSKVKTAMDSPRDTGAFQWLMEANPNLEETRALEFVELEGAIVLGILGETEVIPLLLKHLRMRPPNMRAQIIIGAILRDITGQQIGGYIPSDEDIAAWEEWWDQSESV